MNQPLTLNDLLDRLEKQAADDSSEKKEKDEDKAKDKSEDKSKDKSESKEKAESKDGKSDTFPFAKKTEEDAEKKDERVKEAQLSGAALAQEILQKVASANITPTENKDTEMNKQASVAGKALADSLLQKLASTGDVTTVNGIPAGVVPNKAQVDSAALVAEHDARVQPTPTADAKGDNGGSVNQIFDAIIADALAAGAATPHELAHNSTSSAEGAIVSHQAPASINPTGVGGGDEVEKAAAVSALVNSGFDFDSAVEMVKAAEEEIRHEENEQIKQAALGELIHAGVDAQLAAALVKQAGLGAALKSEAGNALAAARNLGKAPRMAIESLAKNRLVQGVAAAGVGAGAKYAIRGREKKAAVDSLMNAGVDYDSAVDLVNAKAIELYGA